ncbi:hypothetical protein GCM10007384_13680 [Aquimarina muelleri]|uniref:Uncharacterized protein n=1 Tax=Aquimarina muelleri TaxID=279356 RepID=A0A918JV51_9FLAO|nr:hypothetical protein GCM10007384_13680 [Aquimarina muelleri]
MFPKTCFVFEVSLRELNSTMWIKIKPIISFFNQLLFEFTRKENKVFFVSMKKKSLCQTLSGIKHNRATVYIYSEIEV